MKCVSHDMELARDDSFRDCSKSRDDSKIENEKCFVCSIKEGGGCEGWCCMMIENLCHECRMSRHTPFQRSPAIGVMPAELSISFAE